MATASSNPTSRQEWDGAMAIQFNSGTLSLSAGTEVEEAVLVAPCDLKLKQILLKVETAPTGAASTIGVGLNTDANGLVNGYSVATSVSPGDVIDIPVSHAAVVTTAVPRGSVIKFTPGSAATAGGLCYVSLVFHPAHMG